MYACITYICVFHIYMRISHTYACITHIRMYHIYMRVSHIFACMTYKCMYHTHMYVSDTYACITYLPFKNASAQFNAQSSNRRPCEKRLFRAQAHETYIAYCVMYVSHCVQCTFQTVYTYVSHIVCAFIHIMCIFATLSLHTCHACYLHNVSHTVCAFFTINVHAFRVNLTTRSASGMLQKARNMKARTFTAPCK
jgi:hypothetical protein